MTAIRTVSRRRRPFAFVQTRTMHPQWIGMAQITSLSLNSPIAEYGQIGDCYRVALVSNTGSIDWTRTPRFYSPFLFACVLDAKRGGYFAFIHRHATNEIYCHDYAPPRRKHVDEIA